MFTQKGKHKPFGNLLIERFSLNISKKEKNVKDLFTTKRKTGSGKSKQVTGKAADAGYTAKKGTAQQAANRETLATVFGLSDGGNSTAKNISSTVQTGTPRTSSSTVGRATTGLAADSGYTKEKADQQRQSNQQTVQN